MPAPDRRFVHQQHPTGSGAATLRYPSRLSSHQAHDPMPTHPVMTGSRPNRHPPGVLNKTLREPASQPRPELVVVLQVPLLTVTTPEPAATPHQSRAPAAHLQVTNPLRSPVPHLGAAEPTMRTPGPLPGRFHLNLEAINGIDRHPLNANTRQVQTNRHNIRHRGPSWDSAIWSSPIPAGPHPQSKDFNPPIPHFRAGPTSG